MPKIVKLILCLIIPVTGFIFYIESHYFQADYTEKQKSTEINFEPFFKTDSSGPDYIPLPPELTHFDKGVLKVCGDWGTHPDKEDFKILLNCPQNKEIVEEIYDRLDHQVITPNADLELFKDELTQI